MLVSSKTKHEKIVLGLLSFTFTENQPSSEELRDYLADIKNNESFDILLYRQDQMDNFIGIIIIEKIYNDMNDNEPSSVVIHRLSVTPSFRGEGVGYTMFCELKEMFSQSSIIAGVEAMDIVAEWSKRYLENK